MKIFVAFLLLTIAIPLAAQSNPSPSWEKARTGGSYLQYCTVDGTQTWFCAGYSTGMMDALDAGNQSEHAYCLPDRVTNGQRFRVLTKYIADHPEAQHLPTPVLFRRALIHFFPCHR